MNLLNSFVLSWNLQQVAICKEKSMLISKTRVLLLRQRFGKHWFKWPKDFKHFTTWIFYTEISSVPMYFSLKTAHLNLVILTTKNMHYIIYLSITFLYLFLLFRWFKRFKSSEERISIYSNRYSLLCFSRGMEGLTLWYQERYLVTWMCSLWNVCSQTPI